MDDLDARLAAAGFQVEMSFDSRPIDPAQVAAVFGARGQQAANDLLRLAISAPPQDVEPAQPLDVA